jgi:hypothetical protein
MQIKSANGGYDDRTWRQWTMILAILVSTISFVSAADIPLIKTEELKKMIESKADIVVGDDQHKVVYERGYIPETVNLLGRIK